MFFRQLFDQVSSTYSYLLADAASGEAVLIDSVYEQHARDVALIRELGLRLVGVLDTHCHADHVTGAWLMKRVLGSKIALAKRYGASNVDVPLTHGDSVRFGRHCLEVRATPGHTDGCLSFVAAEEALVFSGDALLVRGAGRTDFQNGDAELLFHSIREQLFSLGDEYQVFPAHDYEGRSASTIGEERAFNPRIGGGARAEDFVGYMRNLALPHPKQLASALPANLRSGEPEETPEALPAWGPIVRTYAGLNEIAPEWLAQHPSELHVLDVRSAAEFDGELGHLSGAQHVPLDDLRGRVDEVARAAGEKPVVVVCQTGRRSGMGSLILSKAGIAHSASLAGGMVAWRSLGLPVA